MSAEYVIVEERLLVIWSLREWWDRKDTTEAYKKAVLERERPSKHWHVNEIR
jgi:hypothetical protein